MWKSGYSMCLKFLKSLNSVIRGNLSSKEEIENPPLSNARRFSYSFSAPFPAGITQYNARGTVSNYNDVIREALA
jgi:hypothetical protein